MIHKNNWQLSPILLIILISCSPVNSLTPVNSPTPSFMQLAPTPISTLTPASTNIHENFDFLTVKCAEILPSLPGGTVLPGTLVLKSYRKLSLLNWDQHKQRTISGKFEAVGSSPDRKWLAYINFSEVSRDLVIESADGQKQIKLPIDWNLNVFGPIPWLDNERILFIRWNRNDKYDLRTLVLNPFTGERQELLSDYPAINHFYFGPSLSPPLFFGSSNVAYDPSLRYVVYPMDSRDGLYDALLDRETGRMKARILTGGAYLPSPIWLPDGSAFVVAGFQDENSPREWWLVNLDGKILQLTHFGERYSEYEFFYENASISPDGHYLAFGLFVGKHDLSRSWNYQLIVLDLQTLKAIGTCIPYDYYHVWSPDSDYIAIQQRTQNKNSSSIYVPTSVIVINPEQGWVVTIFNDNNEPHSWTIPGAWLDTGK